MQRCTSGCMGVRMCNSIVRCVEHDDLLFCRFYSIKTPVWIAIARFRPFIRINVGLLLFSIFHYSFHFHVIHRWIVPCFNSLKCIWWWWWCNNSNMMIVMQISQCFRLWWIQRIALQVSRSYSNVNLNYMYYTTYYLTMQQPHFQFRMWILSMTVTGSSWSFTAVRQFHPTAFLF